VDWFGGDTGADRSRACVNVVMNVRV